MAEVLALRVPEAAARLSIGRTHCYELIKRGDLPAIRVGAVIRVPAAALEAWVAAKAAEAAGQ